MILAMNPARNGWGCYKISFGIYAAGTIKHKPLSIPLQGPSAAGAGSRLTVRSWPRLWCRLRFLAPANRKQAEKAASLPFTQDRARGDLDCDPMLKLALVKLVEIVGEAADQLTALGRVGVPPYFLAIF